MNISAPYVHRPVATTLLTVAIALAGAVAFRILPVSPTGSLTVSQMLTLFTTPVSDSPGTGKLIPVWSLSPRSDV